MAWSYADYETQTTDALRLSRLRLHIAEVEAAIDADLTAMGRGVAHQTLNDKMNRLQKRRAELEAIVAATDSTGGFFVRGRCT